MDQIQGLCFFLLQFFNDDDDKTEIVLHLANALMQGAAIRRRRIQTIVFHERLTHYRPSLFSEYWINLYSEYDFFMHFRMQRQTFDNLMHLIGQNEEIGQVVYRGGFQPVELEKMQQMSLYYLAYQIPLCEIGDKFNVATSTVLNCIETWMKNLIQLGPKLIKWPSEIERHHVKQRFRALAGFPGVIGAIDGCHINIMAPADQQRCYQNRYTTHSVILQGICTADLMFTNVFVGFPGSANDSRVLTNCELYKAIEERGTATFFGPSEHLLGDKIYPLKEWLLPPFKDYGHMTIEQKRYNKIHSKTRVKIENCFGLLKGRWRGLKYIQVYKVEKASKIIMACCILHNFCLINDDLAETLTVDALEVCRVNIIQNARGNDDRGAAVRKRGEIMRMLQ